MLTPDPYANLPDYLLALQGQAVAAYVRHATHPERVGTGTAHLKLWARAYEGRAALAEQNPAFAQTLLPTSAGTVMPGAVGLPLVPAAVRWAVDEASPGTVTLTMDIAGAVTVLVQPPNKTAAFNPVMVLGLTRATTIFAAAVDGLYLLTLSVGGSPLATLYVPVTRTETRLFREDSRALRFAFNPQPPRPTPTYLARLARLAGAEALAVTRQPTAAAALLASARALPPSTLPTGLYTPLRPC